MSELDCEATAEFDFHVEAISCAGDFSDRYGLPEF